MKPTDNNFFNIGRVILIAGLAASLYYSEHYGGGSLTPTYINLGMIALLELASFVIQHKNDSKNLGEGITNPGTYYVYRDFKNNHSVVEKATFDKDTGQMTDDAYAFMNIEGEIITEWFAGVSEFFDDGVAIVMDYIEGEPRYNFVNEEGKLMLCNWVYDMGPFVNGLAKVFWAPDSTVNYVKTDGSYLWKEWKPVQWSGPNEIESNDKGNAV